MCFRACQCGGRCVCVCLLVIITGANIFITPIRSHLGIFDNHNRNLYIRSAPARGNCDSKQTFNYHTSTPASIDCKNRIYVYLWIVPPRLLFCTGPEIIACLTFTSKWGGASVKSRLSEHGVGLFSTCTYRHVRKRASAADPSEKNNVHFPGVTLLRGAPGE